MTNYTLRKGNPATTKTDAVVVAVGRGPQGDAVLAPGGETIAQAYGRRLHPMLAAAGFTGNAGETLRLPTAGVLRAAHLILVGIGDLDALTPLAIQRAAGTAARNVAAASSVALALPARTPEEVTAAVSGFASGSYRFTKVGKPPAPALADVIVVTETARRAEMITAFENSRLLEEAADQARDWTNTPPNLLTPEIFATEAAAWVGKADVAAEIVEPDELARLGCGGILGVGQAAANTPRLLRTSWSHPEPKARIALVGKGITYDSGGLTIKPGSSMATMKYDMAGAAAVIAAARVIASLDLPVDLRAYAPMAENAVSGSAMRPGDVITIRDGQTVEIANTDAEGRLILADALSLATEDEPDLILEISTLTGPCIVALGDRIAGLFGTDDAVATVENAADRARELVWRLPIPETTVTKVRSGSTLADLLQHDWVRWGSASYAAAFLSQFVGEVPFAHLDIAGPAWNGKAPWGDQPAGATGFGVRTLVETVAASVSND
ncbi:MAG: leucyl aminopeptidase [Marmoricola sp.]